MTTGQTVGIGLLVAGLGWFTWKVMTIDRVNDTVPLPVQQGGTVPEWLAWAQLALSLYGDISDLWQPGGPFYGMSTDQVYDAVPDELLDEWNWYDPNDYPQGYV